MLQYANVLMQKVKITTHSNNGCEKSQQFMHFCSFMAIFGTYDKMYLLVVMCSGKIVLLTIILRIILTSK